jgi:GNAT superfamily N-acetyltransferase
MNNDKEFCSPVQLSAQHDTENFSSGEETLDTWLRERALANMEVSASKTYVICPSGSHKVIGYYAICIGQIFSQDVVGSMQRNMPRQIPAVILGRLAIDEKWQGRGLGKALLQDVVQRSVRATKEVSARLLVVHSISAEAEAFYLHHGFTSLPTETSTYALDLVKFANLPENPS